MGAPLPFTACSKMKMAGKTSPSAFLTISLEMCAELCFAVVLQGFRSKAAFWLVIQAILVDLACSPFSLLPSPAGCSVEDGCMCEDSLRVSMETLLGGPGDPTPQREGKEDQVPALGKTSIREVLQRQASCLQEGKLGFSTCTHPDTPKCTNTLSAAS